MGSFSNQSIRTVARQMLGGATDLLLGCLVGCVTDWQQETRSLSYFPHYFRTTDLGVLETERSVNCPGLENRETWVLFDLSSSAISSISCEALPIQFNF